VKAEGARLSASVGGDVSVAGAALVADCAGALYWPEEGLLAVADLHLEKGSSFATRGVLLPPYDTAATLAKLGALVARYAPRFVVALGDSFHDGDGPQRVSEDDRAMIGALQRGRDWIWIAGNHDPEPVRDLGGVSAAMFAIGPLVFRHAPEREEADGEIAGHLHPVARVNGRGRTVSRRCFATDGKRMVMPAFGAYTGGLNIRSAAFADVFGTFKFMAHMLGDARIYAISAQRCRGD
jgi:DNA ligase-associated metallophosphoesterase